MFYCRRENEHKVSKQLKFKFRGINKYTYEIK